MKKLIAILLSALMLCTMIPFATVAAADEPTIVVSTDAEEYNAGDEIEVTVELLNNPGVIAATVEILYDHDALELPAYFDEDEEMWMPQIEVGSKFHATSNKYITFGPIDEEAGVAKKCVVSFIRGTASSNVTNELFFTATFKVKDTAVSGNYDLTISYDPENFFAMGEDMPRVDFGKQDTSIVINGADPLPPACEHEYFSDCDKICMICGEETRPEAAHNVAHVEAKDATCYENGNIEYWFCEVCGSAWLDADCIYNTNLMSVVLPMGHGTNTHVEAKDATCFEPGNIEYWYCEDCGSAWLDELYHLNTNLLAVVLPISHNVIHVEALEPTCFEPGNIEYWYCEDCGSAWLDELCHLNTNLMAVVLPISHNVIHVEALEPTCTELGNIEYWYCEDCGSAWLDELCHLNTNMMAVKLGASCKYGAEYVAAKDATCYEPGNVEYWYCANCDVFYADADCTIITNAKNVVLPISHNIIHVEALEPTCTELGNIEYWYCEDCGSAWLDELCHQNTNMMAVKLGASCKYGAEYVAAKDATCYEPGNVEYWYCANCDVFYADADCTIITNAKNVILPISHNIIHVEAVEPTCFEPGNIEYWYCEDCGSAWLDELCHLNTNLMAVVLPISHNVIHVEALEPTCTELGNIEYWYCEDCGSAWLDELCHLNTNMMAVKLGTIDHTYTNAHDADCNVCGEIRDIVLSADEIILYGGKSVSEVRNGLAFKFDAAVDGIVIDEEYIADYTNATVTIGDVEYKLIGMGAIMNNKGLNDLTLADVDDVRVLNVAAEKVFGEYSYAVRIVNIPADKLDTQIIARPYFIYENAGEQIVVYGENESSSYNDVLYNG